MQGIHSGKIQKIMSRIGIPVFKYNVRGELIDSFATIKEAASSIRMDITKFRDMVKDESFWGGYIYSYNGDGIAPLPDETTDFTKLAPWEKNGLFDVNGWSKACLY